MTWTYSQPTSAGWANPVHEVRYLLHDTTQTPTSPTDEEVTYLLSRWTDAEGPDFYAVAATIADGWADQFSAEADSVSKSTGNTSISRTYTGRVGKFRSLADRLWGQARTGRPATTTRYSGFGIAAPEEQSPRQFAIGQFDTPGTAAVAGNGGLTPTERERRR